MQISQKQLIKISGSVAIVAIGTFLMALGNMAFVNPYDIVPGGFSGFAILLNHIFVSYGFLTFLTAGIITLALNLPMFLFGLRVKGKTFGFLSVVGTIFYSVWLDLIMLLEIDMKAITDSPLLATIYGGICMGVGFGIIIRQGGSTGGSDMLANVLQSVKPDISIGTMLLLVDGFVVVLSGVVFSLVGENASIYHGIQSALYAFLVIVISSLITDFVVEGKRSSRAYYIFCSDPDAMAEKIMASLSRGVTAYKAKGMYTKNDREVLVCVALRTQAKRLKQIVFETDPKAFVYSNNVSEVFGEGFAKHEFEAHEHKKAQKKEKQSEESAKAQSEE